jgi:outer membrane receptor protein involved in Fe transport
MIQQFPITQEEKPTMMVRTAQAGLRTKLSPLSVSVALALSVPGMAFAADAVATNDALNLDAIVVTATGNQKNKLESSISVTDVNSDLIEAMNPQSQSEIFRLIPGMIVGDTAGPGGNANISVRGLPITTGGSPFVQIQEDGLPTVLFGDMNFGNNDYWTRFDVSNTIESVRGGSASTLASGAPGAVINYVSDSGAKKGGVFNLSSGLGYDLKKATFAFGGPLNDSWRFHADGFFELGHGVRDQGFDAQKGYQIKANVTHTFDDKQSYLRFYVKLLDDQSPTYTSYPYATTTNGGSISSFSAWPGFDARTGSTVGIYNQTINVMDAVSGQMSQVPSSGIHPVAHALGTELHYVTASGVTVDDKFRFTQMSGSFSTQFGGVASTANVLGSQVNGYTVGSIVYAGGPNAGHAYTNPYLINNAQIYTHMGDMGSTVNDLSFSNKWKLAPGSTLSGKAGLFYMNQTIAQDWHPNAAYLELNGANPAMLNLVSTTGQQLSVNGVTGYNSQWGTCCARTYDMHVADSAPYVDLTWDQGALQLEASARQDFLKVTGWAENATSIQTGTVQGATVSYAVVNPSTYEPLNYGFHYNSYSLGALYLLADDTSAFVRTSRGGKANTDRNILSGYTNANGSLNAGGAQRAFDVVYQQEVGVKTKGQVGYGQYGLEATVFHDSFSQSNFDLTQCNSSHVCGWYSSDSYSATGLELEGSYKQGHFSVLGQLTYTHANIDQAGSCYGAGCTLAGAATGIAPANTPSLSYMISPTYSYGPVNGGLVFQGQGKANVDNNGTSGPGQNFVDVFANYAIDQNLSVGVHVNNLFNSLGINGHSDGNANGVIMSAPGVLGRVADVTLTIKF